MRLLVIMFITLGLLGCKKPAPPLPKPKQDKEIIVVTHNGPSTYYVNGDSQFAGLEYDLVKLFVKELGPDYTVKFLVVSNITQIIPNLEKGKAHFAAAGLSVTPKRQESMRFSVPYQTVQERLVYNKEIMERNNEHAPKSLKELSGKTLIVPEGTSYAERLSSLGSEYPQFYWQKLPNISSDELLEQVAEGSLDYTIADDHLVSVVQNYYPNLGAGLAIGEPEKLAWAFPKNGDPWLLNKANAFFERIKKDGTLNSLLDRYYGHSDRLNPLDVTTFLKRTKSLLPQYIRLFKHAQELTGLDWRLLAAISYQESHWDTFNTSPTNVRGLMMLTEETADRLGVTDRLDPKQSIIAGARYILTLRDMVPKRIQEPDRTWIALAAYNIGYAHVEDARVLAQRLKLNPDSWADLKKTLPLLNRVEYHSTVKYGYASGGAPVIFVESIRTYHNILERYEPQHTPVLPDFNLAELDIAKILAQ